MVNISYEEGVYVFTLKDDKGFVVTDGTNIEELYKNVKDALDLHYGTESYSIDISTPLRLSFSNTTHASHV